MIVFASCVTLLGGCVNFRTHIAWKPGIFWKALFSKSCLEWCSKQYVFFIFSVNDPIRELWGRPLKCTFLNNSKTVKNLWTLVEQKLFEILSPFFLYQGKGAGPFNQGSKKVFVEYLFTYPYFDTSYRSKNVAFDNLNLIIQLFRSNVT